MKSKYSLDFIKKDYNSDLLVSEYIRMSKECGLLQSEKIIFEKYLENNDKILDIGCGAGRISFGLYNLGFTNISGCDIAPKMICAAQNEAKQNNINIKFFKRDICKSTLIYQQYDVAIFSFNGLMCIPNQKNRNKAIKNINKLLCNNGLFIFTCHDRDKINSMKSFFNEEQTRWNNGEKSKDLIDFGDVENPDKFASYLHIPSTNEIENMLTKNGFNIIEVVEKNKITDAENLKRESLGNYFYYVAQKVNKK